MSRQKLKPDYDAKKIMEELLQDAVAHLYSAHKSVSEIMDKTHLSRASVHSYLALYQGNI